jgi:hypothetical protein
MCDQVSLDEIKMFQNKECQGDSVKFPNSGTFSIQNIKSMVIPENFKVTFIKKSQKLDFDHQIWGTYIDDTETHIDKWKDKNEEVHDSFDDVSMIIIDKFTERSNLLALSCSGLLEPPIVGYEPLLNGSLNQDCDRFLDVYCNKSDNYSREVCGHRQVCVTSNSTTNNNAAIILVVVALIVVVTFCYIFYISQQNSRDKRVPYIEEVE